MASTPCRPPPIYFKLKISRRSRTASSREGFPPRGLTLRLCRDAGPSRRLGANMARMTAPGYGSRESKHDRDAQIGGPCARPRACGDDGLRAIGRQGPHRADPDPVRTGRDARPAGARRLQSRREGARRQARRPGCRGDRRRRRAEARHRRHQGQGARRSRQGRFRRRPDLLERAAGDPQAGARRRRHPDQRQCRPVELCRQGVPPQLLRHLLPERPGPRGAGQGGAEPRLQEGLSPRPELPGRARTRWRASSVTSRARWWRNPTSR